MTETSAPQALLQAVERYFALMYDNDVSRFDLVFAPSAKLHGLRDAELRILPARDYNNMLASAPSPKSNNAPRLQEILLVDVASPEQAMVKVRVRIDTIQYLDYLSYHRIRGSWLITAKSFHVERRYEAAAGT
jgi:Putative lumazine-binding